MMDLALFSLSLVSRTSSCMNFCTIGEAWGLRWEALAFDFNEATSCCRFCTSTWMGLMSFISSHIVWTVVVKLTMEWYRWAISWEVGTPCSSSAQATDLMVYVEFGGFCKGLQ